MYDSIIFDLDGTLWDAVDNILISWNEVLKTQNEIKYNITKPQLTACMGLKMDDIAQKLFPELDKDKQMELMTSCSEYELEYLAKNGAKLFKDTVKVVKALSKTHKLFICSNCQRGYIECFLQYFKLEQYFTDIECWGNTKLSKGENNLLLIKRNRLKAPVYVGDTHGDSLSAQRAGIPFVFAAYGFGDTNEYNYKINSIEQLIDIVNI